MSFLSGPLAGAAGGLGAAAPTGAATKLGQLVGADPSRIGDIAGGIGKVANGFAAAGGATPGYDAPAAPAAPVDNHIQMLDPGIIQQLVRQFGGQQGNVR